LLEEGIRDSGLGNQGTWALWHLGTRAHRHLGTMAQDHLGCLSSIEGSTPEVTVPNFPGAQVPKRPQEELFCGIYCQFNNLSWENPIQQEILFPPCRVVCHGFVQ
jgi:hypothetical protein